MTPPAYLLQRETLTAVQGKHVCDQSDNDDVGVNATVTWPVAHSCAIFLFYLGGEI